MHLIDAVDAIYTWLRSQPVAFLLDGARETAPAHFQVAIRQLAPEPKRRVFAIVPTGVADCWEVKEEEAA